MGIENKLGRQVSETQQDVAALSGQEQDGKYKAGSTLARAMYTVPIGAVGGAVAGALFYTGNIVKNVASTLISKGSLNMMFLVGIGLWAKPELRDAASHLISPTGLEAIKTAALTTGEWIGVGYAALGAGLGATAGLGAAKRLARGDSALGGDVSSVIGKSVKNLKDKLRMPTMGVAGEVQKPRGFGSQ